MIQIHHDNNNFIFCSFDISLREMKWHWLFQQQKKFQHHSSYSYLDQNRPLFVYFFIRFTLQRQIWKQTIKAYRWCALDSNLGRQDKRSRQIHWTIVATQNSYLSRIYLNPSLIGRYLGKWVDKKCITSIHMMNKTVKCFKFKMHPMITFNDFFLLIQFARIVRPEMFHLKINEPDQQQRPWSSVKCVGSMNDSRATFRPLIMSCWAGPPLNKNCSTCLVIGYKESCLIPKDPLGKSIYFY